MRFFHYTDFNKIVASFGGFLPINIQKIYHKEYPMEMILNHICTFDTETTTLFFYDNKWQTYDASRDIHNYKEEAPEDAIDFNQLKTHTLVYLWTFTLYTEKWQLTLYGRKNSEFKEFIEMFQKQLELQEKHTVKLIIYVHNLAFDFSNSLQNIFEFKEIFARKAHKPIYVRVDDLLEFRCSYFLTNSSLANLTKDNKKYRKQSDFSDYNKIRFPHTDLSNDAVLQYAALDTASLAESLHSELVSYKRIDKIPLTATGKLRRYVKTYRQNDTKSKNRDMCCVPTLKMYNLQVCAFQGGDTHENPIYAKEFLNLLDSLDRRSSYPAVEIVHKLPSSPFNIDNPMYWERYMSDDNHCFIGMFTFYELECDFPIAYAKVSKSFHIKIGDDGLYDNGRIFKAKEISMICTNIDVAIMQKSYHIKSITCSELYVASCAYETDAERRMILEFYKNKTELKGIPGREEDYMRSKKFINANFGRNVTALLDAVVEYDNNTKQWKEKQLTDEEKEEKLEKLRHKSQYNMYARGVFITAWARWELYRGIEIFGSNHVYNDTDSVKGILTDEILEKFNELNKKIIEETRAALPDDLFEMSHPKTPKGEEQPIGTWEWETEKEKYKRFVSYGAKKYGYEDSEGNVHLTVSGLSKKAGKHLKSLDEFKLGKRFTTDISGRTVAKYQTEQPPIEVDGYVYDDKVSLSIIPTTYELGITDQYENFLNITQHAYSLMKGVYEDGENLL